MIRRLDLAIAAVCEIAAARKRLSQTELSLRLITPRRRHIETSLQDLVRAGILNASAGAAGGYVLGRDADRITFDDVLSGVDARYVETRECAIENAVHNQVRAAMKGLTIAAAITRRREAA
jgi:DNA-binding IscR family transcriptional regulator